MAKTVSITATTRPPISVIQATYRLVCTPDPVLAEIETDWLTALVIDAYQVQQISVPTKSPDDWLKFQSLTVQWRDERGAMSSISEAALCPAYQSIIGMGATAVPFLIAQLESEGDEPDQWFWALKAITGADPVRDQDRGDFVAMARSWLDWAENQEYAW